MHMSAFAVTEDNVYLALSEKIPRVCDRTATMKCDVNTSFLEFFEVFVAVFLY